MCRISVTPILMESRGSLFHIVLSLAFTCRNVASDHSVEFIPVLVCEQRRVELPHILICGFRRYRALKIVLRGLQGDDSVRDYIYKPLKAVNAGIVHCRYKVCLDYRQWMSGAIVHIVQTG